MGWEVKQYKPKNGKLYIEIRDTTNKRDYDGYFALGTLEADILSDFAAHVTEHRAEIAAQEVVSLDLKNFEGML